MSLAQTHGHLLTVKQKIKETKDACTFVLEVPTDKKKEFEYHAGQFLTLFLQVNGEDLQRSYSISSTPAVDAHLSISVKRVTGGRASNWLCDHLKEGDELRVSVPMGSFYQANDQTQHYILFAAGSGITPIFSILKEVLSKTKAHVHLFFGNRTEQDVIYREGLESWQKQYGERLSIHHHLSEKMGRCSEKIILNFIATLGKSISADNTELYLCGPEGFMINVESSVKSLKNPLPIRKESFGSTVKPVAKESVLKGFETVIGSGTEATPETIRALINGELVEVQAHPELSVLESLLEAGHNPPFSCMEGSCMACMAKLKQGKVYQDDPGILTEDNLSQMEILTCQAKPLSARVELDFDDL